MVSAFLSQPVFPIETYKQDMIVMNDERFPRAHLKRRNRNAAWLLKTTFVTLVCLSILGWAWVLS